jgi:predicted aconitase
MFHAVGITPEAPTLMDALQGRGPVLAHTVRAQDLRDVRRELGAAVAGPLTAIALGTPHLSVTEFESLRAALRGRSVADGVAAYVSTSRAVLETIEERGWRGELEAQGVSIVVDTCTYLRPLVDLGGGTVLTNSAKWAWYAPMTLGVDVIIGSLHECVESAVVGHPELSDVF